MKEAILHVDEKTGHPLDVHFDGGQGTPIEAFLLITAVPVDPPASHVLVYGNSDVVGKLLYNFWRNSVTRNPDGAWVIEQVARDIIKAAEAARGEEIPDPVGNA